MHILTKISQKNFLTLHRYCPICLHLFNMKLEFVVVIFICCLRLQSAINQAILLKILLFCDLCSPIWNLDAITYHISVFFLCRTWQACSCSKPCLLIFCHDHVVQLKELGFKRRAELYINLVLIIASLLHDGIHNI